MRRLALVLLLAALPLAAAELDGEWNFTWDTEGGVRTNTFTFVQKGDKLTATMGDTRLEGTVNGDSFELTGKHYSPEAGYSADLEMTGKRDGDKLTGKGDWDSHLSTFTAVRAKQ